jgi:serine/threonine protein kinase/Tfp pilus assembly protein PilF
MNESQIVDSKAAQSVCAQCGSRLSSSEDTKIFCVACLLHTALGDEHVDDAARPPRFDQYELITDDDGAPIELGHGAMGVTYKAFDTNLRCEVALKVIHPRYLADESSRTRFLSEARAAAQLRHRNVASVFHLGSDRGEYFYAMELVEGETIEDRVRRQGPIDCATALDITLQITRALTAAGDRKFVHRDIKPSNVMLCTEADGAIVAKLIDFGLVRAITDQSASANARLARTGFIGTPNFASPEQFAGQSTDARSDIFSLGVTLWFMLTGKLPFDGTREEIQRQQLSGVLPLDQLKGIPHGIVDLIKRMLNVDSAKRPESPAALKEQLNNCITAIDAAKQKQRRRFAYSALAAAVIITSVLAASYILQRRLVSSAGSEVVPEKSIAVLPFQNLSGDPDNAYFANGIQDEILTRLSKISDLKVIARTSVQHYQGKPENLSVIGKQLGVAYILEGNVQKSADTVRVNVQLIKAANDSHRWADTFDRKLTDIFAVETEIAKTVADTLQAKLTGSEERAIAARPTENPEAHELYLKGRFFWNKRTSSDLKTAIQYFDQAIEKDPNYALAYAGLADAYALLTGYSAASVSESFPRAEAAAKKALELDDSLAEAHTPLGLLLFYKLDFQGATQEFERAIALNPNYATGHHWYGLGPLRCVGDHDKAIAELKRALQLDPLSLIINADLGVALVTARRYDKAIAQLRKTIEMDPYFYYAHFNLGKALQLNGQLDEAVTEYKKAAALNDDPLVLGLLAQAYPKLGQRDQALKTLEQLQQTATRRYVWNYTFALVHIALGENDKAIDFLERDYREHADYEVALLKVDPMLDPLRGDPRFEALVAKVFAPKGN